MLYDKADSWKRNLTTSGHDAVDRLLRGSDRVAPVAHAEGDQVLTWLAGGAAGGETPSDLDAALLEWCHARLTDTWHEVRATGVEVYAAKLIDVFNALPVANLPRTKACVRDRLADFDSWCGDLAEHASRDVRAILYDALTEIQTDRRFLSTWYRFCDQAGRGAVPDADNYAQIALLGLRKLPAFDDTPRDALRPEALTGLARYGRQLADTPANHRALIGAWCTVTARHRDAAATHADQIEELIRRDSDKPFAKWWAEILEWKTRPDKSAAQVIEPPPKRDTEHLIKQLNTARADAIENMVAPFRARHESYANATGDSYALLRAFNRIGNTILDRAPELARDLAETALTHDDNHEYSWVLWSDALVALGRDTDAQAVLWEARRRFVNNAHVRVKLGDLLVSRGRAGEAEWVYRETMRRFPDNPAARTALADMLAKSGDTANAIAILRETIRHHPDHAHSRTLLARVLIDTGKTDEGERRYRETLKAFPANRPSRLDLGLFLLSQGREADAEAVLDDLRENAPNATQIETLQYWLDKSRNGERYPWRPLNEGTHVSNGGRPSNWAEYAPVAAQVSRALFFAEAASDDAFAILEQDTANELRRTAEATLERLQRERPHNPVVRLVALRRRADSGDGVADLPAPSRFEPAAFRLAWALHHDDVAEMDALVDAGGEIAPVAAVARLTTKPTEADRAARALVELCATSFGENASGLRPYVQRTLIDRRTFRSDALASADNLLDFAAAELGQRQRDKLNDLVDVALLSLAEEAVPFALTAEAEAETATA